VRDGRVRLEPLGAGDMSVARWGARRQGDVFEQAFHRELEVVSS
jgi:hypothetical protein